MIKINPLFFITVEVDLSTTIPFDLKINLKKNVIYLSSIFDYILAWYDICLPSWLPEDFIVILNSWRVPILPSELAYLLWCIEYITAT